MRLSGRGARRSDVHWPGWQSSAARRGAMLMRQCRKRRDNLGFCSLNLWGLVKKLPLRKERNLRRASPRVHIGAGVSARADAQSARGVQKARFVRLRGVSGPAPSVNNTPAAPPSDASAVFRNNSATWCQKLVCYRCGFAVFAMVAPSKLACPSAILDHASASKAARAAGREPTRLRCASTCG